MAQAFYQGGATVFDFTNSARVQEIAYFDRGPIDANNLIIGGYWSVYYYNGYLYGSEIARGLDIFELTPSEFLSQNEIDAAKLATREGCGASNDLNVQCQPHYVWPAHFTVARAYLDQLARDKGVAAGADRRVERGHEGRRGRERGGPWGRGHQAQRPRRGAREGRRCRDGPECRADEGRRVNDSEAQHAEVGKRPSATASRITRLWPSEDV
jgi:hypothetical protein